MTRTTEIKARLFDLQAHSCDGRMSFPPQESDHGCTLCSEIIHLQAELRQIMDNQDKNKPK